MKRILLVILFALILCNTLFSSDYNVCIVPGNSKIQEYVSSFYKTKYLDSSTEELILSLSVAEKEKESGEALHSAYLKEDKALIASSESTLSSDSDTVIPEYLDVKVTSGNYGINVKAVEKGDIAYLDRLCTLTGAHLLLIPVEEEIEGFSWLRLFAYDRSKKVLRLLYRHLTKDSAEYTASCVLPLSSLFTGKDAALVYLENLQSGSSVFTDGEQVKPVDGYVVLSAGTHELMISLEGYTTRRISISVEMGSEYSLDVTLKRTSYETVSLFSLPVSEVFIDGKSAGTTPLSLSEYDVPLVMKFKADGYSDKTVVSYGNEEKISVSLKPVWMDEKNTFNNCRDGFYRSFARTLLLFGCRTALSSFSSDKAVLKAAEITFSCAVALSITDMISSLIDYYRSSEYDSL